MRRTGDLMTHVRLMSRMAQATGTDLVRAVDGGTLSQSRWAAMVQRCRRCDWAGACSGWLDAQRDGVQPAPDTCRNGVRFRVLRARQNAATEAG